MEKRKGANSRKAITPSVQQGLDDGSLESATLSEALAVDFGVLLDHVIPTLPEHAKRRVYDAHVLGIKKRMMLVASVIVSYLGEDAAGLLRAHRSDTVRGWAAFIIGDDDTLSVDERFSAIRSLADDPHFGVREWAWLAMRDTVSSELEESIRVLTPWVGSSSENIRRFAIESTRPRGVWSSHIPELKRSPQIGRVLLDGVMEDASRYVRDSCGNWLNDAAKSEPRWVIRFCDEWMQRSGSPSVSYIVRRALRGVDQRHIPL